MQGTEGPPCSEDKDRTLGRGESFFLLDRYMLTNSAYNGTTEKCFLKFIKQMTKMRMKSPAFSVLKFGVLDIFSKIFYL